MQDAAAALPARLFGDVGGKTVVDLCAAPGGKTAQLAQAGARVTADRSIAGAHGAAARQSRAAVAAGRDVVADAAEWPGGGTDGFDGVLVDAPCTSTGTIRRHPDVAWLRQEADIAALAAVQKRLLQKAVALLKPGGTLVYCTCSLEPEEGEQAIASLLAAEPDMRRMPIEAGEVAGLERNRDRGRRPADPALPFAPRRPPAWPGWTDFTRRGWLNPDFKPQFPSDVGVIRALFKMVSSPAFPD